METKKFDFSALTNNANSSKNLQYESLYTFVKEQQKAPLNVVQKKVLRNKVRNFTPSELSKDSNLCAALILSGFLAENKNKEKFADFIPMLEKFKTENKL